MNKQETLEEAKQRILDSNYMTKNDADIFEMGVKWQAERSYSEKQMDDAYDKGFKDAIERMYSEEDLKQAYNANEEGWVGFDFWFEQFKKK